MDSREHELRHVLVAPQQPVKLVDHAPGHDRTPLEPGALDSEPLTQERAVAKQHLGDLIERQLKRTETANRNRVARLLERVPAIPGELVHIRRPKAKLLRDAGEITEGTEVEVASAAGTNDARSDKDVGGRSTTVAPVYEVTDNEGHAEKVDTRDLKPLP